ncbi:MAG: CHAT domain-containing protein [Candidatus Omnitrophota bacterium]
MGLTRGFIYAGSPLILASLWNIDDKSTSLLMENFYKDLKNNPKAESLRLAQLSLIKSKIKPDSEQRGFVTKKPASVDSGHPYYWAAFELVGEGR